MKNKAGVMEINDEIDRQVAALDALTPEEELEILAIDTAVGEAETIALQVGDRVLRDLGLGDGDGGEQGGEDRGWQVGSVQQIDMAGSISVIFDGERDAQASKVAIVRPGLRIYHRRAKSRVHRD